MSILDVRFEPLTPSFKPQNHDLWIQYELWFPNLILSEQHLRKTPNFIK